MGMRKTLASLIREITPYWAEALADYLIKNGTVIPVRCKDCKHWLKDVAGCTEQVGRCEWANYMVGAVGYCVYGERRNDGT
jgi:hypothetical protein